MAKDNLELYSGDTLPIWNYWMLTKEGKLDYLLKEGSTLSNFKDQRSKQLKQLAEAWEVISDEMNDVFVKDPDFVTSLIKEKDYIYKKIDATLNPTALTKLKLQVAEKDRESESEFDYHTSIAILEKYLGFSIDDRKMSVKKYYTHLRLMKEANKPRVQG